MSHLAVTSLGRDLTYIVILPQSVYIPYDTICIYTDALYFRDGARVRNPSSFCIRQIVRIKYINMITTHLMCFVLVSLTALMGKSIFLCCFKLRKKLSVETTHGSAVSVRHPWSGGSFKISFVPSVGARAELAPYQMAIMFKFNF